MTDEQIQEKKGLHPMAWVGIGCLVVVVIGIGACMVGGVWLGSKAKDFVEDVESNPVAAAAEMFVKLNPEIELVESDRDGGTITIKEVETGKVMTFDYEDIEEGRFSFEGDDGETLQLDVNQEGGEDAVLTMTTNEGTTTYGNAGQAVELPGWLPDYDGSVIEAGGFSSSTADGRSGSYGFKTEDSSDQILAFYRQVMEDLDLEISDSNYSGGGSSMNSLSGKSDTHTLTVTVTSSEDGTGAQLIYQGPS